MEVEQRGDKVMMVGEGDSQASRLVSEGGGLLSEGGGGLLSEGGGGALIEGHSHLPAIDHSNSSSSLSESMEEVPVQTPSPDTTSLRPNYSRGVVFQERSFLERLFGIPVILVGLIGTAAGIGYGLRSLYKGDNVGQARGMSMRIGFQLFTIVAICLTVGIKQSRDAKQKNEWEKKREERILRQRAEKKALLEKAALAEE